MAAWTHVRRTGVRKGRGNLRIFRAISSPRRAAGRLRSKSPACEGAEEDRERSPCHRDDRADGRYGLHWASNGMKRPALGTNRKSRLENISSIPSAQDAGFTGFSSPHLTTVGMLIGSSGAWADGLVSSSYVARYQPKLAFMASGRAKVSTIASNSFWRTLSLLPTQWS